MGFINYGINGNVIITLNKNLDKTESEVRTIILNISLHESLHQIHGSPSNDC